VCTRERAKLGGRGKKKGDVWDSKRHDKESGWRKVGWNKKQGKDKPLFFGGGLAATVLFIWKTGKVWNGEIVREGGPEREKKKKSVPRRGGKRVGGVGAKTAEWCLERAWTGGRDGHCRLGGDEICPMGKSERGRSRRRQPGGGRVVQGGGGSRVCYARNNTQMGYGDSKLKRKMQD